MSILCVVLKITLYRGLVAGIITVKNGATLGRNVCCILRRSRGIHLLRCKVTGELRMFS